MESLTSLENILATSSVAIAFITMLFSFGKIAFEKYFIQKTIKEIKEDGFASKGNIVLDAKTNQITIKDRNEKIGKDEIEINNIKPTEIYISNNYSNFNGDKNELGKKILGDNALSFENEHLSNYYKQTLYQSQISFWFSLIFASLGFALIILAAVAHAANTLDKTIITIISGVVIDSIAALFFVQSNNAKKAVGTFFEKLRKDKQIHDAIKMTESIENNTLKDTLKVKISLSLLGIASSEESSDKLIQSISDNK